MPLDAFKLREASEEDLEFAYELDKKLMKPYAELHIKWNEDEQRRGFAKWFHQPHVMQIIEVAGKNAGVVCYSSRGDFFHIESLELDSEFQNLGIGSKILKLLITEARKHRFPVKLLVFKENDRAISLYKKLGFEIVGEDLKEAKYYMRLE